MSNSTRPGGYDERLVVPLEASRRGAHRARVNPFVAALPLLAVVVVVAAVIGVAYQLFLKPSPASETGSPSVTASSPGPAASQAPAPSASGGQTAPSPSGGTNPSTGGKVDKSVAFTVFNGSTTRTPKLGAKAMAALQQDGWTKGTVNTDDPPLLTKTTRVYYPSESQKAAADALVKSLGVGSARQKTVPGTKGIVVIVGDDFKK